MSKYNLVLMLLILSAPYDTLVGTSGNASVALMYPIIPETIFVRISRANKPQLSIVKGAGIAIPEGLQDTCELNGTDLHVDFSGIKQMLQGITLEIPRRALVIFLTEHQEFPLSPEEEAGQMDISD